MNADFSSWLADHGYSAKVQSDILSRLKRASTFINIDSYKRGDSALLNLERKSNFLTLSVGVKSQLRRSVRLYFEFKSST